MSKKHLIFIILLTVTAVFLWIIGETAIIMFLKSGKTVSIIWTALMAVLTLSISVWKGLKDDSGKNSRKW